MSIDLAANAESDDRTSSTREFFHAWRDSDMARITELLAPDCEWYRDGQSIPLTDAAVFHGLDSSTAVADITPEVINIDDHGASALLIGAAGPTNAGRPVGFINLKFDHGAIAKVSEARLRAPRPVAATAAAAAPARVGVTVASAGAKAVALVLYCVIDEFLFSIPVLALAALWDPWRTFLLLTPIYFVFAMTVGYLVAHLRQQRGAVQGSALQRWLDTKTARREANWERRALLGFGVLGTGVVTIILGPILTPWLAHRLGLDRGHGTLVVGSAFWSLCLVGTYSGLIALIF